MYGRSITSNMLQELGIESAYNYYMDVSEDTFIHFTLLSRAKSIISLGKIRLENDQKGYGPDGVYAISETFGKWVPSVQLYVTQFNPDNEPIVALQFKTNDIPAYAYPEEVIWKQDVNIIDPSIISIDEARQKLTSFDEEDFIVTYNKQDAHLESAKFKSFMRMLNNSSDSMLMETISKGFDTIFESGYVGKELIVVDIQPAYAPYFRFKPYAFTAFLNEHYTEFSKITLLYNGPDLGLESESDYIEWLVDNNLSDEALDKIRFFEKGYNFFRNAMDQGIDHDEIVRLLSYMAKNDINDSRDLDDDLWNAYLQSFPADADIVDFLRDNEDAIFIPDLIDELDDVSSNVLVMGGGKDECLAEVLIALKYLGKAYKLIPEFVY